MCAQRMSRRYMLLAHGNGAPPVGVAPGAFPFVDAQRL